MYELRLARDQGEKMVTLPLSIKFRYVPYILTLGTGFPPLNINKDHLKDDGD